MSGFSEPAPEEGVVGGAENGDPRELGGEDTVEANDDLTIEEVER